MNDEEKILDEVLEEGETMLTPDEPLEEQFEECASGEPCSEDGRIKRYL